MIEALNLFVPRTVSNAFATEIKSRIDMQDEPGQIYSVYYTGDGEIEFKNGNHYKGDILKGLLHGQGQMLFQDGTLYEGDFHFNKMNGKGTLTWPDGCIYKGEFKDGIRHGRGNFENPLKGSFYEGDWINGKRHGKGTLRLKDGSVYAGDFENGVKCGQGKIQYPSGNYYEGGWSNGQKNGKGTMHWLADKQKYEGEWSNDLPNGVGTLIWIEDSGVNKVLRNRYSGNFVNGLREGLGIFYYANGSTYEGYWIQNKKHGYAMYTNENGEVSHCYFRNDRLVRKIEVTDNLINSFANNQEIKTKYTKYKSRKEFKTEEGSLRPSQIENTVGSVNSNTRGGTSLNIPSSSQNANNGSNGSPQHNTQSTGPLRQAPTMSNVKPGHEAPKGDSPTRNPTRVALNEKPDSQPNKPQPQKPVTQLNNPGALPQKPDVQAQKPDTKPIKPATQAILPGALPAKPETQAATPENAQQKPQEAVEVPVPVQQNADDEAVVLTQNIYMQLIDVADFISEENSKKLLQSVNTANEAR